MTVVAEAEAQTYVSINEEEVITIIEKEKRNKTPKWKILMDVSLPLDDEDIIYVEEDMLIGKKTKSKVGQSVKFMGNNEDQSESSKGSKEIIKPGVDLEDKIIKTKQNFIRDHLMKNKLINGGQTFQINVN